ncbi:MAG: peptide chain release factor N(5)-glutamine methyltransferase [Clostridia bacterium]|nr:peptide chain release factor N(5)-glutamine methyltransferase [Clostridia bacterium]
MVIGEALIMGTKRLKEAGILSARLDSEVLLAFLLQKERSYFLFHKTELLPPALLARYEELLARRALHEPVAYLVGEKEFMSLPFFVSPGILIPRPDTETLAEHVISLYKGAGEVSILDVCTGSGAIAVSLACYLPQAEVSACDISSHCVETARNNAARNGVSDRVSVFCQDVLSPFPKEKKYDCVVSNPPYIPTAVLSALEEDVRDFEPAVALDGGADGLLFYRHLTHLATGLLKPGGHLAFEVGHDQAEAVSVLLQQAGFSRVEQKPDLAGVLRVVSGFWL